MDTRLTVVVKALERHHKVQIELKDAVRPRNCRFTGDLSGMSIEEAIETVAVTLGANWEKQDGEFAILRINC